MDRMYIPSLKLREMLTSRTDTTETGELAEYCARSDVTLLATLCSSGFLVHAYKQRLTHHSSNPDLVSQARSPPGAAGASSSGEVCPKKLRNTEASFQLNGNFEVVNVELWIK